MNHKVLHIIGNRPHYMKLAPVHRAFSNHEVDQVIVHTGQHYDHNLTLVFQKQFELPAVDHQLQIQASNHAKFLGLAIIEIDTIIQQEKPDLVIIYGDTNTTAAGAIATSKNHILLAHVEAGLRENDKSIPEEINKLLSDGVSDLLFAPTNTAVRYLESIGRRDDCFNVGDTGFDLLLQSEKQIEDQKNIVDKFGVNPNDYYFMTCHRAANTDKRRNLYEIVQAVNALESNIIWPIHPRTKKALEDYNLSLDNHIIQMEPLGYFETQALLSQAQLCITDSGGIIKEAYFHNVPSIIIDKQTEWIEIVHEGWTTITGPNKEAILEAKNNLFIPSSNLQQLGDGTAGQKIADICLTRLS